ncbi:hypothetical protein HDU99_008694, partial [Rhizoclosmatium hyalinum]
SSSGRYHWPCVPDPVLETIKNEQNLTGFKQLSAAAQFIVSRALVRGSVNIQPTFSTTQNASISSPITLPRFLYQAPIQDPSDDLPPLPDILLFHTPICSTKATNQRILQRKKLLSHIKSGPVVSSENEDSMDASYLSDASTISDISDSSVIDSGLSACEYYSSSEDESKNSGCIDLNEPFKRTTFARSVKRLEKLMNRVKEEESGSRYRRLVRRRERTHGKLRVPKVSGLDSSKTDSDISECEYVSSAEENENDEARYNSDDLNDDKSFVDSLENSEIQKDVTTEDEGAISKRRMTHELPVPTMSLLNISIMADSDISECEYYASSEEDEHHGTSSSKIHTNIPSVSAVDSDLFESEVEKDVEVFINPSPRSDVEQSNVIVQKNLWRDVVIEDERRPVTPESESELSQCEYLSSSADEETECKLGTHLKVYSLNLGRRERMLRQQYFTPEESPEPNVSNASLDESDISACEYVSSSEEDCVSVEKQKENAGVNVNRRKTHVPARLVIEFKQPAWTSRRLRQQETTPDESPVLSRPGLDSDISAKDGYTFEKFLSGDTNVAKRRKTVNKVAPKIEERVVRSSRRLNAESNR